MKSLELLIPDEVDESLTEAELQVLAQEAFLVRLYELGKIGSGKAAQHLGVSRRHFLEDVLARYGATAFDEDIDLAAEAARG